PGFHGPHGVARPLSGLDVGPSHALPLPLAGLLRPEACGGPLPLPAAAECCGLSPVSWAPAAPLQRIAPSGTVRATSGAIIIVYRTRSGYGRRDLRRGVLLRQVPREAGGRGQRRRLQRPTDGEGGVPRVRHQAEPHPGQGVSITA